MSIRSSAYIVFCFLFIAIILIGGWIVIFNGSLTATIGHGSLQSTQTNSSSNVQQDQANGATDLVARHPDAGIWVAYRGSNSSADLQQPYIKGVMTYARWNLLYKGPNQYDWGRIDQGLDFAINQAGIKTFVVVTAGYCPEIEWPQFLRQRIASHKEKNNHGCHPLQFWDPEYIDLYKSYIRAFAEHLAAFDAADAHPDRTDILYVRAQVMADTMENLPKDYTNWRWQDFHAAPNGRIHQVDLTEEIVFRYQRDIVLAYKNELEAAYQKYGLTPPIAVAKGASFWKPGPNREKFVSEGIWFDKHSGSPNPQGWYYDMIQKVRSGENRGTYESGAKWPTALLSQYTYWETLAVLHSGIEFIGIFGSNPNLPHIQPKGPVNFTENQEAMLFAEKYAGHIRNPEVSPGAWVALRGSYPEYKWDGQIQPSRIWTNYEFLVSHYRPQDSVLLFGVGNDFDARHLINPIVERENRDPWQHDMELCQNDFSNHECDYLHQPPDRYLGLTDGKHTYTFRLTDLGEVLYCGADAFCEDRASATRSEQMLWARRTDKDNGHNFMRFDIDDQFAQSLGKKAKFRVVYLDRGTGRWELQYDSLNDRTQSALIVEKQNSNIWKEVVVSLDDVRFDNRQESGTDFSIFNMNDDDDIIHIVEIIRSNENRPTRPTPTLEPPSPTPTAPSPPGAPTSTPTPIIQNSAAFVEEDGQVVFEAEDYMGAISGSGQFANHTWEITQDVLGYSGSGLVYLAPDDDLRAFESRQEPRLSRSKFQVLRENSG